MPLIRHIRWSCNNSLFDTISANLQWPENWKARECCEQVMFDLDMYFLAGLFAQDDQDTVVSLTHFVEVVIAGLVGL